MSDLNPEAGKARGERLKRKKTAAVERRHFAWVRRIQRVFLAYLIEHPSGTTDDIRTSVRPPAEAGTSIWGAAVLGLATGKLIAVVDRKVSGRASRHGCEIRTWRLAVEHDQARRWLDTHADLPDPPTEDEDGGTGEPCPAHPTPPPPSLSTSQAQAV